MSQTFDALEQDIAQNIGFRLFTVLLVDLPEVVRLHSSNLVEYPISGRKLMGPTPWGTHVITQGNTWLGQGAADIEWAFPDHALIASLGCGSCLSIPVRHDGQTLGTLNILDAEGRYNDDHLRRAASYATRSVPLLQAAMTTDQSGKDLPT